MIYWSTKRTLTGKHPLITPLCNLFSPRVSSCTLYHASPSWHWFLHEGAAPKLSCSRLPVIRKSSSIDVIGRCCSHNRRDSVYNVALTISFFDQSSRIRLVHTVFGNTRLYLGTLWFIWSMRFRKVAILTGLTTGKVRLTEHIRVWGFEISWKIRLWNQKKFQKVINFWLFHPTVSLLSKRKYKSVWTLKTGVT